MDIELHEHFKQIPVFQNYKPEQFSVEKLSGFTNLNFRLVNDEYDWVLRIPKPETNIYINREQERHNYSLAVELELVPKLYWHNKEGMSLIETLRYSRTLSQQDLQSGNIINQLLLNIYRLHSSKKIFRGEVNLTNSLQQYFRLLTTDDQNQLRCHFEKAQRKLSEIDGRQDYRVPSHNDLVLENLLIENRQKIWLIDWEYSAMASPYWDLASLCNAAKYSRAQCEDLLQRYNALGTELVSEYLHSYRFALQTLSICWLKLFTEQSINTELYQLNQMDS